MADAKKQSTGEEAQDKVPPPDNAAGPDEEISFASALKMLEETVKSLESGELSLEDSLAKFEEGIKLARRLEAVLDRAERKVREIMNPESPESKE